MSLQKPNFREYHTGMKYCFWRWKVIDSNYLIRLHIIKTPIFAICMHWILRPDRERDLHDHPVNFLSIILRGGYVEERSGKRLAFKTRRFFNFIRATDIRRICYVNSPCITLCFMGPKIREWGFYTSRGWIYWKDYFSAKPPLFTSPP